MDKLAGFLIALAAIWFGFQVPGIIACRWVVRETQASECLIGASYGQHVAVTSAIFWVLLAVSLTGLKAWWAKNSEKNAKLEAERQRQFYEKKAMQEATEAAERRNKALESLSSLLDSLPLK